MNYTKGGFPIWDDEFEKEYFTPEEIAESNLRVAVMTALISAEKEQGMDRRKLEELSGVAEPQISELEAGESDLKVSEVMKVLATVGKTLAVVPLSVGSETA